MVILTAERERGGKREFEREGRGSLANPRGHQRLASRRRCCNIDFSSADPALLATFS